MENQIYENHDPRFGARVRFTIPEMIKQYRVCGWDEYDDDEGHSCKMTKSEIEADILTHDIVTINMAARALGSICTAKKARSSAENGKLGGRPEHLRGGRPRKATK